jgi:hypothetical protein
MHCVLQPTLVHLCQIFLLLPSSLPIVSSDSLRLLYLLLYSEHINHIQVLGSLNSFCIFVVVVVLILFSIFLSCLDWILVCHVF